MGEALVTSSGFAPSNVVLGYGQEDSFVTLRVDNQLFGIPVYLIQDVLRQGSVTPVPLASPVIAGSMNLRGRTVTVIDLRKRLGLPEMQTGQENRMNIVVEHKDELVSLLVDEVGDVLSLPMDKFEKTPPNMNECWRDVSAGIYRLDDELLVVLDVAGLLNL